MCSGPVEHHDCMRLTCAHSEFSCRRSSILVFCKKILNEHKSAAQMWDIALAGYTSQSAMETLLIITTGSDECSHDAQELLSTWLQTASMYMHLLASPDTVIARQPGQQGALQSLCNQVSMTYDTRCSHCNCSMQQSAGCGETCCDPSTMASAAMRPDLAAK